MHVKRGIIRSCCTLGREDESPTLAIRRGPAIVGSLASAFGSKLRSEVGVWPAFLRIPVPKRGHLFISMSSMSSSIRSV